MKDKREIVDSKQKEKSSGLISSILIFPNKVYHTLFISSALESLQMQGSSASHQGSPTIYPTWRPGNFQFPSLGTVHFVFWDKFFFRPGIRQLGKTGWLSSESLDCDCFHLPIAWIPSAHHHTQFKWVLSNLGHLFFHRIWPIEVLPQIGNIFLNALIINFIFRYCVRFQERAKYVAYSLWIDDLNLLTTTYPLSS